MDTQILLWRESTTFICTECGDGFSKYSNVVTHMAIHGPLESFCFDGSSNGFEVPREYVLQENGTLTVVNGLMHSHQLAPPLEVFRPRPSELNLDSYCCEICNKSFTSLQGLLCHQRYRNGQQGFRCTLCCKFLAGRKFFIKHLQGHSNQRFHSCGHCGKRFLKLDALNTHRKEKHLSEKALPFGKCENKLEKRFEKPYSCKKCKLNFFWMSDFQTHSLHHSIKNCYSNGTSVDVKNWDSKVFSNQSFTPYRCGLCGDRFQNLTALKEHHLTHQTQEEIDRLNDESKTFKPRIQSKGRRRRSNPNGKLHPCKHCHRVFNHSSSLSRHMRYHKGTMHTCMFCGRHFPQRCDLRRHIAMYHNAELDMKPALKLLFTTPQNDLAPSYCNGEKNTYSPKEKRKSSYEDDDEEDDQATSSDEQPYGKQSLKAGRGNYQCEECGKKFGLLCVYQRHLRYHKKEPTKFPKFPAQFRSVSPEHPLQIHPSCGENSGQMCLGGAPTVETALQHEEVSDRDRNKKEKPSVVLYECSECMETFSCLETFLHHQTSHSSQKEG
uniref:C2H2-type domain-containing protein n=1 Tax=Takifugu rubripes TaxID=31033 RepID=H2UMR8_TAKRU